MEITRFIARFSEVASLGDFKQAEMVRLQSIKPESSSEIVVPQLATVILLNLPMQQMRANKDWHGMASQTKRIGRARGLLHRYIDVNVEDLTEIFWLEDAINPVAAQANRKFLYWAINSRTCRTARGFGSRETA